MQLQPEDDISWS